MGPWAHGPMGQWAPWATPTLLSPKGWPYWYYIVFYYSILYYINIIILYYINYIILFNRFAHSAGPDWKLSIQVYRIQVYSIQVYKYTRVQVYWYTSIQETGCLGSLGGLRSIDHSIAFNMDPKWVQSGSKMGQNGFKMGPKWVQNGSQEGPEGALALWGTLGGP